MAAPRDTRPRVCAACLTQQGYAEYRRADGQGYYTKCATCRGAVSLAPAALARARARYEEGATAAEVAAALGVDRARTVYRVARREGWDKARRDAAARGQADARPHAKRFSSGARQMATLYPHPLTIRYHGCGLHRTTDATYPADCPRCGASALVVSERTVAAHARAA